jgi:hypothetical protein
MNRKFRLVIAFIAIGTVVTAGVAAAASSPTVSTSSATSIKQTSAVLRGAINPNGASTTFQFLWGQTRGVYGSTSPIKSVGHGTAAKAVEFTAPNLLPGTVYHYTLTATSRFGTTAGADRSFKTAGTPPPAVATGGVSQLTPNSATLNGVVNPQNANTTYFFQYGTTINYGFQTFPNLVAATTATVPVSQTLTGLSQFTTFHYRLVAEHGSIRTYGLDQFFVTFASPRFVPRLSARTSPRRDRFSPYIFNATGTVRVPSSVPPSLGCAGNVTIRYFFRGRNIAFGLVPLQANCTFSSQAAFRHLPGRGKKRRIVHLRVRIFFRGNGYVAPRAARPEMVALGRT